MLAFDLSRNAGCVPPDADVRIVPSIPAVSRTMPETPSNEELLTQSLLQERADADLGIQRTYDREADLTMPRVRHNKAKKQPKQNSLVPSKGQRKKKRTHRSSSRNVTEDSV